MSDLKAGDLAMVVKYPCCGAALGRIFSIAKIWGFQTEAYILICYSCHTETRFRGQSALGPLVDSERHTDAIPTAWLRKIDPLAEPERELEEAQA